MDDILVITKESLNEHENELDKILEKLDKENLAINLQKCETTTVIHGKHHLIKIIQKLAKLTEPQRPLLKKQDNKNKRLNWNEIHSQVFDNIKQKIKQL